MAAPTPHRTASPARRRFARRTAAVAVAGAAVLISVMAGGPGASAAGPGVTVGPNVDVSLKQIGRASCRERV